MKLFVILVLCFVATQALTNDCETGMCDCQETIVTCTSVFRFPSFVSRIIETLILIDGSLNCLPVTHHDFPRLRRLVMRNLNGITCETVSELRYQWPDLIINTDLQCDTTTSVTTVTTATTTISTPQSPSSITAITMDSTPGTVTGHATSTLPPSKESGTSYTALVASITTIGIVVVLIIIALVGRHYYKKYRNRVEPIMLGLDNINYGSSDVYESTTV